MKDIRFILTKTIVKSFYRQNLGFFFFFFIFFFGIIPPGYQIGYHETLIRGMLQTPAFLGLAAAGWLLYGLKVSRYVTTVLDSPEYSFLQRLREVPFPRCYRLFLEVQILLFLPVWSYAGVVAGVALHEKKTGTAIGIFLYIIAIIGMTADRYYYVLLNPGMQNNRLFGQRQARRPTFHSILIRYLLNEQLALLAATKLFGCALLYWLLKGQTPEDYDLRMPYLFYSIAIFGHGLILHRCRTFEDTRLLFYRAMPVSLLRRFSGYALLVGFLLLPEMLTVGWLTPHPMRWADAITFVFSGYSLLLLLIGLLLAFPSNAIDFLKRSLGIFGILYFSILGNVLVAISVLFLVTAILLFFRGYSRYDGRLLD